MGLEKTNSEKLNERVHSLHMGEEGMSGSVYDIEKLSSLEKKLLIAFIDEYIERIEKS